MKAHPFLLRYTLIAFLSVSVFASCEDDYESDADDLSVPLTIGSSNIKAPGRGQYKHQVKLVDGNVTISADLSSFNSVSSLTIIKTLNTEPDPSFGNNGVLTVNPGSDDRYDLNYQLKDTDVDQLAGLTFRVETGNGEVYESDLTLVVTLTPLENLPRKKWMWKSKIWVDGGNAQDIKDCEKDNYFLFNADGTMSLNYGANTGSAGCDFDGFNVYDTWSLSDDEKEFVMIYHSIFSPDQPQTERYRVKTFTTDKLELEIDYDLSWLGLSTEETFLYEFTPMPR